jgi:peptidoglycan/xylan/chitin deacetylase (PgdA/CDA1 family)
MPRSVWVIAAAAAAAVAFALAGCGGGGGSATTTTAAPRAEQAKDGPAEMRRRERAALRRFARLGRPILCGGPKRYAALTFDDGPGPYTALARRILRRHHVPATFFLVGRNVQPWAHQARAERRSGAALGDHSWTHPQLPLLGDAAIDHEMGDTQRTIERFTGQRVRLFRPPYGAHDARVDRTARRLGMVQVLWNVDSRDSEGANYAEIARRVLRGIGPGAIVLMHENRGQTIRALKFHILPALRRRNIELVTVPRLLAVNPPTKRQLSGRGARCHSGRGA